MSLTQLNFKRLTIEMKEEINEVLNVITDVYPSEINIRGDALHKVCMLFKENYSKMDFKELPLNIQGTIDAVNCDYIKWNGTSRFECYESYHKNKTTYELDSEHDKVLNACGLCQKGKSDVIRYRVEEGFRKKGINSIFNLTKLLVRMDIEGAVAQIFLCQAKQFTDDEIIISPDQVHLKCPNLDGELVLIEEYCTTQTDPSTMNPPCKWLIAPFLRVPIKPAPEAKAVIEEMKRLKDESTELESSIKTVDAEIIEPESIEEGESEPIEEGESEPIEEGESEPIAEGDPIPIAEGDPIPIEEGEPIPIEEVKQISIEDTEPQNARDIIAKENEEKKEKESEEKKKEGE